MSTTLTAGDPRTSDTNSAIPFARLVHVEWRKATDTRAARWLIAISLLVTIGLLLAPLLNDSIDQTYGNYLQFSAFGLSALVPVVSILTLTTEWTQRTVLTTFAQEPRRSRVIGAKVTVSLIMAVVAIVVGAVLTAIALLIASGAGRDVTNDLSFARCVGFALFIVVNVGMGVAFGALLHNTPAAVVLFFVLPTLFGFVGAAVRPVGRWIDTGTTFNWLGEGDFAGHVPNILTSVALWLVLPLVLGIVRTARREIS